jgi:hypothetical protein
VANKKDRLLARDILKSLDFCAVKFLVYIARSPTTPLALKCDVAVKLLPYCHSRLSEVDINVSGDVTHELNPVVSAALMSCMLSGSTRKVLEDAVLNAARQETLNRETAFALPAPQER